MRWAQLLGEYRGILHEHFAKTEGEEIDSMREGPSGYAV